jgi:hypothetical protein
MSEEIESKPPVRLYLQWYGEVDPDDALTVDSSCVTWCREKIFKHDAEYIILGGLQQKEMMRAAFESGMLARKCGCGERSTGWTEQTCCNICGAIVKE